jgi:methylthioribose-1-phosphate isomerase
MINEIKVKKFKTIEELASFVRAGAKILSDARPTEPMLFNGMKYALVQIKDVNVKFKTLSPKQIQSAVIKALKTFLLDIQGEDKIRPVVGAKIIKNTYEVMTHCHS